MSCARSPLDALQEGVGEPQDPYPIWLKNSGEPVVLAGGAWWRPYHRALVPAAVDPRPVRVNMEEAQRALEGSGCHLMRYFTRCLEKPSDFWYTACDEYNFEALSANTRSKIRRGRKRCEVRRISGEWLVSQGYDCFSAAHVRYKGATVASKTDFEANEKKSIGGPFERWGVFVEQELVGYSRCVVGGDYAVTLVLKFHPAHLKSYSAYALMDAILSEYVGKERKRVTNGFRALAHDTNVQEFLEQFSFRRVYCDVKVVYRPLVGACVGLLYPFKRVLDWLPEAGLVSGIRQVLRQEEIQRSFLPRGGQVESE